jgi:hypothetical protein
VERFIEPVDDEVGFGFNSSFVNREEIIHIFVAEFAAEEFAAEKGWVADDVIGRWPCWYVGFTGLVVAHNGVVVLDVV